MKLFIQNSLVTALVVLACGCENTALVEPSSAAGASAPAAGAPSMPKSSPPPAAAPAQTSTPTPTPTPSVTAAAGGAAGAAPAPSASAAGAGGAGAAAPSGQAGSETTDAGVQPDAAPSADASAPPDPFDPAAIFPPLSTPETRIPSPDNPAECPKTAPENPVGDCLGLPIYVECNYGTYSCVCDWYHWLCFG